MPSSPSKSPSKITEIDPPHSSSSSIPHSSGYGNEAASTEQNSKRALDEEEEQQVKRHAAQPPPPPFPPTKDYAPADVPIARAPGPLYEQSSNELFPDADRQIKMRALVSGKEAGIVIGQKGSHVGLVKEQYGT